MAKTTKTGETAEPQTRMTFGEHLDELRKRILRALYGGLIGVGLCVAFMWDIYRAVVRPYLLVAAKHGASEALSTLKPQESFFTVLTLAVKAGLILTSPWIIWQLWQFVSAGLFKKERKIVYRYVGPSVVLFLMGVAFFYFIVLPMTLDFFFSFSTQSTPSGPPTPNFLERWLLGIKEAKVAPTVVAPVVLPPAEVGWWRWVKVRVAQGRVATMPAFPLDPPAPAAGQAIEYFNSVEQVVKVRTHDQLLVVAAAGGAGQATVPDPSRLPALMEDPPAPGEGVAIMYFHVPEQRVKVRTHDQVLVPMVVAQGTVIINTWRSDDYLNFVTFTALIFGLAFELPMVMLVLAKIDIVQAKSYRSMRKYAYFAIVVIAVIVAPSGDLMTLAFLFVPLVVLYEVGIIAAAIATRGRVED